MEGERFGVVSSVDAPLLPANAKAADSGASELEPVAALMKHEGGVLVVVVFGGPGFKLLFEWFFLVVVFLGGEGLLEREGAFEGGSDLVGVVCVRVAAHVVVVGVVVFDQLVQRLVLLLAAHLLLSEQHLDLAETRSV